MQSSQKEALRQLAPFWGISAASMETQKNGEKIGKEDILVTFLLVHCSSSTPVWLPSIPDE